MTNLAGTLLPLAFLAPGLLAQILPQDRPVVDAARANPRGVPAVTTPAHAAVEPADVLVDAQPDGSVWALGADWKARFDGATCHYLPFFGSKAPRHFPLDLSLRAARVGGTPLELAVGQPVVAGRSVRVGRGAVVETYDLAMRAVEQSFVFHALPNRGAIEVEIAVASELRAEPIVGGLRFAGELGHVDYTKAVAIDAAGRRLPLAIGWSGDAIAMTIPAEFVADAQLPLVLDPILMSAALLGPSPMDQTLGDVATRANPDYILATWTRVWSLNDEDCYAAVYDNGWNLLAGPVAIDYTAEDWKRPRAASNGAAGNFLVVGQASHSGLTWVSGRTVATNGAMSAKIDIERAGVTGLPGNALTPDVGGDPYPISWAPSYYCVVFTKQVTATNTDVYCKMVDPNGVVANATPTRLSTFSTTGAAESNPSISNTNAGDLWMVTWQHDWQSAPFDADVRGAIVNWNGVVTSPDFGIATSLAWESLPSASSAADVGAGAARFLVAWTYTTNPSTQPTDVHGRLVQSNATLDPGFNLDAISAGGAYAALGHFGVQVDSDGARFCIAYNEQPNTNPTPFALLDTVAFPSQNGVLGQPRVEESRVVLTGLYAARPAAFRGADYAANARYALIAGDFITPPASSVVALLYGGYTAGTTFGVYPTQCGTLPISYSGNPTVGNSVTISVPDTGVSGTVFGFPGYIPLAGVLANCNCILGVQNGILSSNPLTFAIPNNAVFVGTTLSVQGYSAGGTSCLSILDLSDTVDFTIR